jgi:hypothetical protein
MPKKKKTKKKYTKIVELIIADDAESLAIDAISLVSSPAIEENWVYMSNPKNNLTLSKIDEEKKTIISPALIPNKSIFRFNADTNQEYYVYFSRETVKQASELYLKHNNHHKATLEHTDRLAGILTVESWVKAGDSDKSKLYGYDLPDGTWFVSMKVDNPEIWALVKDKKIAGLSIEGYFVDRVESLQKQTKFKNKELLTALKELLNE